MWMDPIVYLLRHMWHIVWLWKQSTHSRGKIMFGFAGKSRKILGLKLTGIREQAKLQNADAFRVENSLSGENLNLIFSDCNKRKPGDKRHLICINAGLTFLLSTNK